MRREIITCDSCSADIEQDYSEYTSVYFTDFYSGWHDPEFLVSFKIERAHGAQEDIDLCKDCAQRIVQESRVVRVD